MVDNHDRCEWVNVSSGTDSPWQSQIKGYKIVVVALMLSSYVLLSNCGSVFE